MGRFVFEAIDRRGRRVRGTEEAASPAVVESVLRGRGLHPLEVETAPGSGPASVRPSRRVPAYRARRRDVTEAFHYLATLLSSGFTLDRALGTAEGLVVRGDVSTALAEARERVRSGASLSDSLAADTDIFPPLSVGMVRAGERGGDLADALERVAEHLDRETELRRRVLSALLYPAFVVGVGAVAVVVLVGWVLPRFVEILGEVGAGVPGTTALLLAAGQFFSQWWWAVLIGAAALAALARWYLGSEAGSLRFSRVLLGAPIVGGLIRRRTASRFGRSLAMLLSSGLPILPALEVATEATGDPWTVRELEAARGRVRAGEGLGAALRGGVAFSALFLQMVELGEEGGRLPEMLERAAGIAESELERRLEGLVRLVEPAMVVLFGAAVGFVALSLLQAIYGVRLQGF